MSASPTDPSRVPAPEGGHRSPPGQVGILRLLAGEQRAEHRSAGPVVLEVLSGDGMLRTARWGERQLAAGDVIQLPDGEPHALGAGAEGLVLRVRRTAPCCERC